MSDTIATHTLKLIIDFSPFLKSGEEIVTVEIDRSGVNVLTVHPSKHYENEKNKAYSQSTELPIHYEFYRFDFEGELLFKTSIRNEFFVIDKIGFLPSNEILLVSKSSQYIDEQNIDKNARIYNLKGELQSSFVVGEGVKEVKIDSKGGIWISYDETGIFGANGWNDPVGSSGLVCWDSQGNQEWNYEPPKNIEPIVSCYAMNIDNEDNVWHRPYTGFPLVKLGQEKEIKFWETDFGGSHVLNIYENIFFTMLASYFDYFSVFELVGDELRELRTVRFQNENKVNLNSSHYISGWGSKFGFVEKGEIYLCDMESFLP